MASKSVPTWDTSWAEEGLRGLARVWRESPTRPRIDDDVLAHWDDLVVWWVGEPTVPLPIRQGSTGRRGSLANLHGRDVVFVDNSRPQWVFARALQRWMPSTEELAVAIVTEMPTGMIVGKAEALAGTHNRRLAQGPSTAAMGLQLHHIDSVSGRRAAPEKLTLEELMSAASRLVNPRNMFVLPKAVAGLGEIPVFIAAMLGSGSGEADTTR